MKTAKKKQKPFWEMNTDELAKATREFDQELRNDDFRPLGPEKQAFWDRLQGQRERPEKKLYSLEDVRALREDIRKAWTALSQSFGKAAARDAFEVLKDFKLLRLGFDPFNPSQTMNLVEQINQSATLLVACAAVEALLRKHPSHLGYVVTRPTAPGYDISAVDASVVAEVFAAVSPGNNKKLAKDLDAVRMDKGPFALHPPEHRYVFFASHSVKDLPKSLRRVVDDALGNDVWQLAERERPPVTIVRLPENEVFGGVNGRMKANKSQEK